MIAQLKSEIRKLLSVRSTYILLSIALVLIGVFAYFGISPTVYDTATCTSTGEVIYANAHSNGRQQDAVPEDRCDGEIEYHTEILKDLPKERLLFGLQEAVPIIITFVSVILVLFVAHEFRYNTISYTLTISNSRSKVLLSKLAVGVVFTMIATLLAIGVNVAVTLAAISIKDLNLPTQDYNWLYIIGRHIAYTVGYALLAIGIAVLVRNLVFAIVALFVLPTLEGLANILLSNYDIEPTKALPFSALDRFGNVAADIVNQTPDVAEKFVGSANPATAPVALGVFAVYLVTLWAITWYLFLRRDAN